MALPNKNHKRKRHNYLVDYQIVQEDQTEEFGYFTDLLGKYDTVNRPKDRFCRKTGDPKSLFLELHDRGFKYPELPKTPPAPKRDLGLYACNNDANFNLYNYLDTIKKKHGKEEKPRYPKSWKNIEEQVELAITSKI